MFLYLSVATLSTQPLFVAADSAPKPGPHTPRLPSKSTCAGEFWNAGSSASVVTWSRCHPMMASISVLLSLNFDVHLAERSVVSCEAV